jgi:hypothetical protein
MPLRLFGEVDGATNRRWDRAMYQTPPFDIRNVKGPYLGGPGVVHIPGEIAGVVHIPGEIAGQIIAGDC